MSRRSIKDSIEETEAILNFESLRDFDKKRIDETKATLTYEATKVLAPLKRAVPNFNLHFKNFREFQKETVKQRDEDNKIKLTENINPLLESCYLLKENMSPEAKALSTSACDKLADTYDHLKNFELTQKTYDMFTNSCKVGTSFRTCDMLEYLHYSILEKEKKGEPTPKVNIHVNINDFVQTKLNFFENKCKNEKDGLACEQMVSYSGEEGPTQLDYAKRSCEYGNKNGCELLAEILVISNNEKDALTYYKKACDLGEGRACISAMMMLMQNTNKNNEKEIRDYARKTVKSKFCLPSVNPQFFLASSDPDEAFSNFKLGCESCNDASSCFSYATLKLEELNKKGEDTKKFEQKEIPKMLMKACGHASLLSNPLLIEPCLSVYLHSTGAFPTND
jgi:TPR repeat protein